MKRLWANLRGRPRRALLRLGPKSKLVLMKLGFDMRAYYDGVLHEPLPAHLMPIVERLPGTVRDIIDLGSQASTADQTDRNTPGR